MEPEPTVGSLKGVRPPAPSDAEIGALVKDQRWLVALGKALFWDQAIGSDGALTDRRVACHAGPFDHPELVVSNGHKQAAGPNRAKDARLRLREVGKQGYPSAWCDPNTGDLFTRDNLIGGMLQPLP